ncbi:MAG: preprotein translocase subunit SecG [Rickettsiales bacterium]|nr:preprotein translocase subunit SecG [Rickettsiales bacterium]
MEQVLLVVHAIVAVLLIGIILLQKSDTDGLKGIGGGDINGSILSRSSASSFLVKTTVALAIVFMINCLVLANISSRKSSKNVISQLSKDKAVVSLDTSKNLPMAE